MFRIFPFLLAALFSTTIFGQTGTSGDPFTTLAQAHGISSPGVFHFNLDGVAFSTYVDDGGYVQVAIDFGDGNGALPRGTALTTTARGILTPTALATLTDAVEVRMTASTGELDAVSDNATYLERITTNTTLMNSSADNALNDNWTGTGSEFLRVDANDIQATNSLHREIYHVYYGPNNGDGTHWIPARGDQAVARYQEEIADAEHLALWVRAEAPTAAYGSAGNPFLSLSDAQGVPQAGMYSFRLGSTDFRTFVDAIGYVQVALDFGDGLGNLPQSAELSDTERGILSPTVLAALTEATELRMTSSVGDLDATTDNATLLERVRNNQSLMSSAADNDFNDDWVGTGSRHLRADSDPNRTRALQTLDSEIHHGYYSNEGLHWIPSRGDQALVYGFEIPADEKFTLWVGATQSQSLPLLLYAFTATAGGAAVHVDWRIQDPNGGEYIDIQRSTDGVDWKTIDHTYLQPAGRDVLERAYTDLPPHSGRYYYRLLQVDYDGALDISEVITVEYKAGADAGAVSIYPNPTSGKITIKTGDRQANPALFNAHGRRMPLRFGSSGTVRTADLTALPEGVYYLRVDNEVHSVIKR